MLHRFLFHSLRCQYSPVTVQRGAVFEPIFIKNQFLHGKNQIFQGDNPNSIYKNGDPALPAGQ
jgi:hypothetical protein